MGGKAGWFKSTCEHCGGTGKVSESCFRGGSSDSSDFKYREFRPWLKEAHDSGSSMMMVFILLCVVAIIGGLAYFACKNQSPPPQPLREIVVRTPSGARRDASKKGPRGSAARGAARPKRVRGALRPNR